MIIRQETEKDYKTVYDLIQLAFENEPHSIHNEGELVERLRKSSNFLKELSLVAEVDGKIVGHILFTPLKIVNGDISYPSLMLAPLAVVPEYQRKGIGKELTCRGLEISHNLGFKSVIVVGHPAYYPKFGFKEAKDFKIMPPFDIPSEAFMALELEKESLSNVQGIVEFPQEFQ